MIEKNELSETVHAGMVAFLDGGLADAIGVEPTGAQTYWRSKARASPSAHRLQRLRRDWARGRLLAQLGANTQRDPEDLIDDTLAESFPASDPPYWTLGVKRGPGPEGEG
jgi:hypothetical protein